MNSPPFFNFGTEDTRPPVTIITKGRNMLLRTLAGEMQHVDAGAEITIAAAVLDQLDAADYELI